MKTISLSVLMVLAAGLLGCETRPGWSDAGFERYRQVSSGLSVPRPLQHEGANLRVTIDGETTRKFRRELSIQQYAAGARPQPTVEVHAETQRLGAVRDVVLTINPIGRNGPDPREQIVLRDSAQLAATVGRGVRLEEFFHVGRDGTRRLTALPAGRYLFDLRVHGERSWDAQQIVVDVE